MSLDPGTRLGVYEVLAKAQIFGLEDPSGTGQAAAIAMELVEGEDLAARIRRGPVPLDEVWPLARQVAEALGGAAEATPYDLSNSPTLTARATQNRC